MAPVSARCTSAALLVLAACALGPEERHRFVRHDPAASELISTIQVEMKRGMKDPESTQFRDLVYFTGRDGDAVCGEVNSRNTYGGYTGFSRFVARPLATGRVDSSDFPIRTSSFAVWSDDAAPEQIYKAEQLWKRFCLPKGVQPPAAEQTARAR